MNAVTTIYTCTNCGAQYPKWQGRCLECGQWGTLEAETVEKERGKSKTTTIADKATDLRELKNNSHIRTKTDLEEFDRVLGDGIVQGSLILLGGDPGIGKSTLALQICKTIKNSLYVSGEESAQQVQLRAQRLKIDLANLKFLAQTNVEKIIATAQDLKPELLIIDSIQTIYSNEAIQSPGSVGQITICTNELLSLAKKSNIPIIIIGHVTKDGAVAGPKTLEHLVDVVLYLENDSQNYYKILRTIKNRFGSTGEIGVFEMAESGLKEITNATSIFMEQDLAAEASGIVTTMIMEGSRPFLVEIQALATKTAFGYPQRKSTGFDLNRLQMLIAVIAKVAKINLGNQDIYLNVVGGLKIKETAVDLAVILAIISAFLDIKINRQTLVLGEVGLAGEIRNVSQLERRIKEAIKLKFETIMAPAASKNNLGEKVIRVKSLNEAIRFFKP